MLLSAPAAMGEEAEVPVWEEVQRPCRSVVITFLSPCLRKISYLDIRKLLQKYLFESEKYFWFIQFLISRI